MRCLSGVGDGSQRDDDDSEARRRSAFPVVLADGHQRRRPTAGVGRAGAAARSRHAAATVPRRRRRAADRRRATDAATGRRQRAAATRGRRRPPPRHDRWGISYSTHPRTHTHTRSAGEVAIRRTTRAHLVWSLTNDNKRPANGRPTLILQHRHQSCTNRSLRRIGMLPDMTVGSSVNDTAAAAAADRCVVMQCRAHKSTCWCVRSERRTENIQYTLTLN